MTPEVTGIAAWLSEGARRPGLRYAAAPEKNAASAIRRHDDVGNNP